MISSQPVQSFAELLQFSISPIVLISAASLLLLSITNRLGRTIDRSRILVRELEGPNGERFQDGHRSQLRILMHRSQLLKRAILCITASIVVSTWMILGIFLQLFLGWDMRLEVLGALFISILSFCTAAGFLFADVSEGLNALRVEVHRHI